MTLHMAPHTVQGAAARVSISVHYIHKRKCVRGLGNPLSDMCLHKTWQPGFTVKQFKQVYEGKGDENNAQ